MIPGNLARRYARALFELAVGEPQREKFLKDMALLSDLMGQQDVQGTTVGAILANKRFPLAQRNGLLEKLGRRGGADPTVIKFLQYAMERGRIHGATDITRAYRKMVDDAAGRVNAEITSAAPLPANALSKITTALAQATGKKIVVTAAVDPDLIGGVVTKVGSFVIDGSVRASLSRLRTELRG